MCEDGDGTYELTPAITVVSVFLMALVCLAILVGAVIRRAADTAHAPMTFLQEAKAPLALVTEKGGEQFRIGGWRAQETSSSQPLCSQMAGEGWRAPLRYAKGVILTPFSSRAWRKCFAMATAPPVSP